MKKVISLFLTVVMALSMFSCLSVMAGAATTDLVVDQEYTVESGTTKIFVPEESGHYKFTSNGYGDPKITINCLSGEYEFDDNDGLNFCGIVELEAGEEVSCYLYNYDGEDCLLTITKIAVPESITVNFTEPLEIVENINGFWNSAEIWNEETESYEYVDFFVYNVSFQYYSGNTITLTYADGTNDIYTCDGVDYFNEQGEVLLFDYYSEQSYENRWTIGSDNYFTLNVMGAETQISVTIVEDPYESIEFIPAQPIEIIENTNGDWCTDEIWNEETDEYEVVEYYSYDCPNIYSYGNAITVNYKDGTSDVYTYDGSYFTNSLGVELSVTSCISQGYNEQWSLGSENYLTIELFDFGKEIQVPVTIIEDPCESIEFIPIQPVEIIENTNGYWYTDEIWNEETNEYENVEYFKYYTPYNSVYGEGNAIIFNYKDGASDTYTCDDNGSYVNSFGEFLDLEILIYQNYDNRWTLGSENYFTIEVLGREIQARVIIIESPYESIEFVSAEDLVIDQYTCGSWSTRYNEETGEEESYYSYNIYDCNLIWNTGNIINLTKKDGSVEVYTCNGMDFISSDGEEYLDINIVCDGSSWDVGSENVFTITAMGKSCDVNVTIVENTSVIHNSIVVAEKLSDNTCMITDVKTSDNFNGVLDIPEEVDGYSVVGIEDGVLRDVYGLEELNLPSTFGMISERLFFDCYDLKAVNVSEENSVFASVNGILYNKALTEILYCPQAFTGDFIIKAGVTELSTEIIARLGKVSSVEVENGNTAFAFEDDILYNADFTKIYKAFSTDADYVMKSTVTEIADYSFYGNDTLEIVTFASGVTEIAYEAFAGCSALKSVDLPESLVSIDKRAFTDTALTEITLPSTTRNIGDSAFSYCSSLNKVNLNEGLESLGHSVFSSSAIEEIVLPNSLVTMGESCFMWNDRLSVVIIGSGLTSIPGYTFFYCNALKNIDIPENITVIGEYSFYCSGLTSISFHDKITTIDRAFMGCDGLTEVYVVDSIISMNSAFSGCENLISAYVGSGVKSMESAFSGCENLETVELAEGISGSCDFAFSGCSKLGDIDLPSTVTELSYMQFNGCEKIESFDIPESVYKVEAHALDNTAWYDNQNNGDVYLEHVLYNYKGTMPVNYTLTVKDGTKSIADSALESQRNLVNIELPDDFKYIGDYAFDGCSGLTGITIPGTVEYIGEYALGYEYNNGRNIVKYEDFVIYGVKNSVANKYADDNDFEFVAIAHTHTESDWIIDADATCKTSGSKHKECTECGEVLETETIKAKGHTEVKDAAVAATCTKAGKTEGSHCSVCGEVIKAQTTVAAKGHKSSSWITDSNATVYKAGSKHKECTECGEILEIAEIPQLKCSKPTLKSIENTQYGVLTKWGKVKGADKYYVYRKVKGGSYSRIGSTTKTYYTDKTAKSGKKYYYIVKAINEAGVSSSSSALSKLYLADPTLKTPTSTKSGVSLKWTKTTGAQGYIIYRKTGSGSYEKLKTEKGVSNLSYVDKSAKKGKKYTYKVKAYYSKTYSAYSNTKTITDKY